MIRVCEVDNLVYKIETGTKQGSGVVIPYIDNQLLLLTCYHVLEDETEITLTNAGGNTYSTSINSAELFVEKDKDVAVLILDKVCIESYNFLDLISIGSEDGENKIICGFPNIINTAENQLVILDRVRKSGEHLRTDIDLSTAYNIASDNVKGFSGGAVFQQIEDALYLEGIIKTFSNEFPYFEIIDFCVVNKLLSRNGKRLIRLTNSDYHYGIECVEASINEVSKIRDVIGTDIIINREDITLKLEELSNKVVIIKGKPGSGKSVVIKNYLMDRSLEYYFLKATDIEDGLEKIINELIAYAKYTENDFFVIIDSCEKIFDLGIENVFIQSINYLKEIDNIRFIFGVRKYSLQVLKSALFFECSINDVTELSISNLSDGEFRDVVNEVPEIERLSKNVKLLLKNPFYLDIVIKNKLLGSIENISNEYQIKDVIWEDLTDGNIDIKSQLLMLATKKLEERKEYVLLDINETNARFLIEKGVIVQNEMSFKFAHDKYEDIITKKMFDMRCVDVGTPKILEDLGEKLSFGRAYKNWISDRLTNNHLEAINHELEAIYESVNISYVWKWNTLESIYMSKFLYQFLVLNETRIKEDTTFVKRVYEVAVSSNAIDLGESSLKSGNLKLYYSWNVIPNTQMIVIIDYFADDIERITDSNRLYVLNVLKESLRIGKIYGEHFFKRAKKGIRIVSEAVSHLQEQDGYRLESMFKLATECFTGYAPYMKEDAISTYTNIVEGEQSRFDKFFIKSLLVVSDEQDNKFLVNNDFYSAFYDELIELILNNTSFTEKRHHRFYSSLDNDHEIYNLNEGLDCKEPYSFSNCFFGLFMADFDKTFDIVIEFINAKIGSWKDFNQEKKGYEVPKIELKYKETNLHILDDYNHYLAYRGTPSMPNFLVSTLMIIERVLLDKGKEENISQYIEKLILRTKSMSLIGVAMSLILHDYQKYGELFLSLVTNYFIREMETQRYINEMSNIKFPHFDTFAKVDREKYDALPHRKIQYDEVFINVQRIEKYQLIAFGIIDSTMELIKLNDFADTAEYNFFHNTDIRNFVVVDHDDKQIVMQAKPVEIEKIKESNEIQHGLLRKRQEYHNYCIMLRYNSYEEEHIKGLNEFITKYRNNEYEDVADSLGSGIEPSISLFYLKNSKLTQESERGEECKVFLNMMNELISGNSYYRNEQITHIYEALKCFSDKELQVNERTIVRVFFVVIIGTEAFNQQIHNILKDLCVKQGAFKNIRELLVKFLIEYLRFNQESHAQFIRLKKGEVIEINEFNQVKMNHKNHIVDNILNGDLPQINSELGFCPERFHVLNYLVELYNSMDEDLLVDLMEQLVRDIINCDDENWYGQSTLYYEKAIEAFIIKAIRSDVDINKLNMLIFSSIEKFHKIPGEVVDTLAAYIHDGKLSSEKGWNYFERVVNVVLERGRIRDLCISTKDRFVLNIGNLDVGRMLESTLMSSSRWLNQIKPDEIKLFKDHEENYLDYLVDFSDSTIGLRVLAKVITKYPKQFDYLYVFKRFDKLIEALKVVKYSDDDNLLWCWEMLLEKIYWEYNNLNKEQRDCFYEMITVIGCNAPSSFALFIRQKIEY